MKKLTSITVKYTKIIGQSEAFLATQHNQLNIFDSIEDLVTNTHLSKSAQTGIEHHIRSLRAAIAKELWSNEIYVGRSILDEFVLSAAKSGHGNIANRVIANLAKAGAERPGFVLYPLTGFGMKMAKILGKSTGHKDWVAFHSAGYAVSAQQNSIEQAHERLTEMAQALGIKQRIAIEDLRHFGYQAAWLRTNPLMLVRLISHTGDMSENQFVYTLKIRTAASCLLMLHALSVEKNGPINTFLSTSKVNNWETLDVRHYLIGENLPKRPMDLRRIPMNVSARELARLSDVAAVISTKELSTSRMRRISPEIVAALKTAEQGYLRHVNLTSKDNTKKRLYKRLATALDWYRQSFGSRANESEAVVAIAVAFETLLTDQYSPGVAERLARRLRICLKGVRNVAAYEAAIVAIYHARSEIVHTGSLGQQANIVAAQAAFAHCFHRLISRMNGWTPTSNEPIRDLLQDV